MKIGFFGVSPSDQTVMTVFAEGILGVAPEPISFDLEARSVPGLFGGLDAVIRALHYNSDADALVVLVDSDESDFHDVSHDEPNADCGTCRYCRITGIIEKTRSQLKSVVGRAPLRIAVGVAVPAIEAWLLVGITHEVGEAAWRAAKASKRSPPFTKEKMKEMVYQTARPSLELATARGIVEAKRIIANLNQIESAFPIGFGLMAAEIRTWR